MLATQSWRCGVGDLSKKKTSRSVALSLLSGAREARTHKREEEQVVATQAASPMGSSKHEQLIEALAEENSAPIEHVRALFEEEHARLQADARVKTFVAVIATRLVRNTLYAERNSGDS
jgi:hypothetical protein